MTHWMHSETHLWECQVQHRHVVARNIPHRPGSCCQQTFEPFELVFCGSAACQLLQNAAQQLQQQLELLDIRFCEHCCSCSQLSHYCLLTPKRLNQLEGQVRCTAALLLLLLLVVLPTCQLLSLLLLVLLYRRATSAAAAAADTSGVSMSVQ